jgi:Tol biopolymer transport system component
MHRLNRVGLSVALIFSIFSLLAGSAIATAFAGQTTRVSVNSAGEAASAGATNGVLSADGRYVVFQSSATNLLTPATTVQQVYRHDRTTGDTVLVSVTLTAGPGGVPSRDPSVSANGRYVVFSSFAPDLAEGDTNGMVMDVFVRDMDLGTTAIVSATGGVAGNGGSGLSGLPGARQISDNGQYVVFTSTATNLVADTSNTLRQIYVKDMTSGLIVRASVNDALEAGNQTSQLPTISGNGRVVAFQSASTNLGAGSDTPQIYVRDLDAGLTTLASVGPVVVGQVSAAPGLSFDGRYVAFESTGVLNDRDLDGATTDVFLRDRVAGTTVLASLSDNAQSGATSAGASISGDGRWVGFWSRDDQLVGVASDTNALDDVFLYDRDNQTVTLVSLNDNGEQANAASGGASVSSNGLAVLFASTATNLVAAPANPGTGQLYVRLLEEEEPPTPPATIEWLSHLSNNFTVGRNLPVKFIIRDEDGAPVFDDSVRVDVVDPSGNVVVGPYVFGGSPSRSVTWNGDTYHVNVDTKDLEAGMYTLRVRFSSPTLTVEFTRDTNGTAGALRSRLRD